MPKMIDPELKARAVRLVSEHRGEYPTLTAASQAVAKQVGVGKESVRRWVIQAEIDAGHREGVTSDESEEIRRLKAENRRLREDVAILKAAATFFASRPPQPLMMGFIDEMRAHGFAVESICRVLREQDCQVAARTYRVWRTGQLAQHPPPVTGRLTRHRHPSKPSPRRPVGGPVQGGTQVPRLTPERPARQHPRVVIAHHDHLLAIS